MRITAFLVMAMAITDLSAQQRPTTGYAPVNGLRLYYEVHGRGEPVVLLHGGFMTITSNWEGWIGELARTRKVIAVEMQGTGGRRIFHESPPARTWPMTLRRCSSISSSLERTSSVTAWAAA